MRYAWEPERDNDDAAVKEERRSERRRGAEAGAAWRARLEACIQQARQQAQEADNATLVAREREQREVEILARQARQAFLLERATRVLQRVASGAQRILLHIGLDELGMGIVAVTTEDGREVIWNRA